MEELKAQMAALMDQAHALGVASVGSVDVEAAKAEAVAAEKERVKAGLDAAMQAGKDALMALIG